jgi:hypothetical protein
MIYFVKTMLKLNLKENPMTHSVTQTIGGGGEGASSVRRTLHHRGDRGYYGGNQVLCHTLDLQAFI